MYQTLVEAVLDHAEKTPGKKAVIFKSVTITYAELVRQMKIAAHILSAEYGVKARDKVMITAMSKPDYIVILLAAQYLGAMSVPIDKSAVENTILDVYDMVSPRVLITDTRIKSENVVKASLQNLYSRVNNADDTPNSEYQIPNAEDIAEILFTTGTTGRPKGVMLKYSSIRAITYNTKNGTGVLSSDTMLMPLPLNHSIGLRGLRTAFFAGATVVLQNGFAFPKDLKNNIENFGCTGLVCVPASLELLYRQMGDEFVPTFGKLHHIEVGAGSLSVDMKKKLIKLLPDTTVYNTWGSTETGGVIFLNVSENPDKCMSLGKPIEGVSLKILGKDGEEIDPHDIESAGRMALKGDMHMAGYYDMPDVTAETIVDGWLYTNDLVYTDGDGFVYMSGRADDIINVGGKKVSPIEVENIATEFEDIRECACIGVEDPDGILGQVPVLYIVPEKVTVDEAALTRFLSGKMEAYKLPHVYMMIDELPRNRMKKLDRRALIARWKENGNIETVNDVVSAIMNRHSVRVFEDKRIPRALTEAIVKAGIQAPSGHNMQSWKFTVIRNKDKIAGLKATIKRVAEEKKVFFYGMQNPDTVILVSNDRRNENGIQDSSCAAENMMIAAQSFGIGSVWINALKTISDEPEIRTLLTSYGVPQKHIVYALLCFGYGAESPKIIARRTDVVNWVE